MTTNIEDVLADTEGMPIEARLRWIACAVRCMDLEDLEAACKSPRFAEWCKGVAQYICNYCPEGWPDLGDFIRERKRLS